MSAIQNKLKSRRGASITFALLLFLVCAVASSIVIVAATASAGRVSGVKETDQRYYAAIGAAETLKDIFDGKQVNVTYTTGGTATVTTAGSQKILSDYSGYLLTKTMPYTPGNRIEIKNDNAKDYTCTVTPKLDGGLLTFTISVEGGTKNINTGTYTMQIVFASNVKRINDGSSATGESATVSWKLHSLKKGRAATKTQVEEG